jgi:glycerol uptake facilitator protein
MSIGSAMLIEGLGTMLLVTVILAITETCQLSLHHEYLTPIWIGTTVAAIISIFAPFTQAGINPARDMGPRIVAYFAGWASVAIPGPQGGVLLVYCLAPLIGGGIAAVAHRYLIERIIRIAKVSRETVSSS